MSVTFAVTVPIMTNAVAVKKGEDLLLQVAHTKEPKRKHQESWKDHVERPAKTPKARAKPKSVPSRVLATEI